MAGDIWALAEAWRGQVSEITYETLALGREVADGLGRRLRAVLLGHEVKGLAETLGLADGVLCADHPALAGPPAEAACRVLGQMVRERGPMAILAPLTNVSWDVTTSLPAHLQAPFIGFCRDAQVQDGGLQARCVLYGGKMEAIVAATGEPTVLGILPGARQAEKGRAEGAPSVEEVAVALPEAPRAVFKNYIEPEGGDVDITRQEVLVCVGRGIQSQENVALAEELARALGGAVCGSRPVVDQGWLPISRQVGKSGAIVKPRLYLAAGVSGAPEHVEGMKNASLIVAINTDPQAPIFNVAHYGVVADAMDLLPLITDEVRKAASEKR